LGKVAVFSPFSAFDSSGFPQFGGGCRKSYASRVGSFRKRGFIRCSLLASEDFSAGADRHFSCADSRNKQQYGKGRVEMIRQGSAEWSEV